MYLKGIHMQGFKSFADKTILDFGKGITTIVGPNGSGKSNVSDAIRWVMGEQSIKSLRGSKMEDVIFAGTSSRKPYGFAEVSIVLDNKDKTFNVDFDEVTVTRRVDRNGEGEYFINKSPCRLKDIHELFMDTGLGREGYSVIGQGKIDEILSSKSEDRRHIFEEAAGITKYRYRKAESEKKLAQTEENLVRIRDIITELESQVGPLEVQSKKAAKYLELKEILKNLEVNISIYNIDKIKNDLKEKSEAFSISFNHLNDEKRKLEQYEKHTEETENYLQSLNADISAFKDKLLELEKDSGSYVSKLEILRTNIKNNQQNFQRLGEEIVAIEEKINASKTNAENINNAINESQKKADELGKVLLDAESDGEKAVEEILNKTNIIESLKGDIIEALNGISAIRARSESLNVLINNFNERKSTIKDEISAKEENIKLIADRILGLETQEKDVSKDRNDAIDELEKLKTEYFEIVKLNDETKLKQNEATKQYNDKQSRKTVLEDLEKSYEGYSRGVKNIVSKNFAGVCGVLSKLIDVPEKYVTAIEMSLGGALQNIVTEDEDAAKRCIEFLKENKLGRATFLPITAVEGQMLKHPPENEKGYIGIAYELVNYDKKYDNVVMSLLGKVAVFDNIDNAILAARKEGYKYKIATLSGEILNAGGSISGGSTNPNHNLLGRSKEIEALGKEIKALLKTIDKYDDIINDNRIKVNKISERKDVLDATVAECNTTLAKVTTDIENQKKIKEDAENSLKMLVNESGDIAKEITDIDEQKASFDEEIKAKEQIVSETRQKVTAEEEILVKLNSEKSAKDEKTVNLRLEINSALKDVEALGEQIAIINRTNDNYLAEIAGKEAEKEYIIGENKRLEDEILAIDDIIKNTHGQSGDLSVDIDKKQAEYDEKSEYLKQKQQELKTVRETIFVLQQETAKLESRVSRLEEDRENVINKLWEEYELTYSDALELKTDIGSITESVKEANSIKRQIKDLGNINLDAIDEYKVVKERYEFLSEQRNDLEKAKSELFKIINQMQTIMVKQFTESFEIIKSKFGDVFKELFGGGEAKLYLNDPDNVLESGIEIEIQPPGKKLQNLMLLSGGEKAFAAIALLFSVLEVRPTPFCLLDEVEAALDDVNVYRFANYVKKYSNKTQFIIVTHRRGTMEAADIMYGITMQEKGISKMLKLNFEDLEDYDV